MLGNKIGKFDQGQNVTAFSEGECGFLKLQSLEKKKRTQINKVRDEKGDITTYTTKTPRIMRNYYEHIYINKMWMNRLDS